jgi:hypothetical protein
MFALVRIAGLALLFLLPMQMRAGANDAHPHAMLHLLLDARDGVIDHHDGEPAAAHTGHEDSATRRQPDVPATASSYVTSGAMAILAALLTLILLPAIRRATNWALAAPLVDWLPTLDPPPPRAGTV